MRLKNEKILMTLNLVTDSSWEVNMVKVNNLQNRIFLNLWFTAKEIKLTQKVEHLFGVCEFHKAYNLSVQKIKFWTINAIMFKTIK